MGEIVKYKGRVINKSAIPKYKIYTRAEKRLVFKRDNYKCVKCGSSENLTIDHIIPRSKGGRDSVTNYQTMCLKCNQEKKDSILAEYIRI